MTDSRATLTPPTRTLTTPQLSARTGLSLGRWQNVQLRVDWSLLIIIGLVVLNLGAGVFPAWHPEWSRMLVWSIAGVAALLFVASVLLHEVAHAWVARRYGIAARQITLFLFGGVTHLEREPPTPRAEFMLAIVGPFVSCAFGFLATATGMYMSGGGFTMVPSTSDEMAVRQVMAGIGPVPTLLLWLGPINLFLGLLNLVPAYPLDGGRALRSLLWGVTRNLDKATRWATAFSRVFAWALISLGVFEVLSGLLGQGLWLLLIGWFLLSAARLGYQPTVGTQQLLQAVPVSRVMWNELQRVSPELSVHRFIHEHLSALDQDVVAVEADDALVGMVVVDDVLRVPQTQWARAQVKDIMTPIAELSTLPLDADAERALVALARHEVDQIPIVEGRSLRGLVRRRDLVRWLALQGQPSHAA